MINAMFRAVEVDRQTEAGPLVFEWNRCPSGSRTENYSQ